MCCVSAGPLLRIYIAGVFPFTFSPFGQNEFHVCFFLGELGKRWKSDDGLLPPSAHYFSAQTAREFRASQAAPLPAVNRKMLEL